MADCERRTRCGCGRGELARDLASELPRVQVATGFRPYASIAQGAMPHEMERAYQKGRDWFTQRPDGSEKQLNPPGFDLTPSGDVVIRTRGERARYMRECGFVDLSDYRDHRETRKKNEAAAVEKVRRRLARGLLAASRKPRTRGPRIKPGWAESQSGAPAGKVAIA